MKLIYVPPGEFAMGSPPDEPGRESGETQTRVRLTRGYYLAATEVTQTQWQIVMSDNPSFTKGPDLPVENVSYIKTVEFCEALSRKEGRKYRLPTEAEWEYACRAGTTTPFWTGKALTTDQANFDGTMLEPNAPPGKDRVLTTPAASFPPNPWGFCDMHGNVWEWCANFYGAYPGGEVADPAGPATGTLMALRGGSWRSKAADCRSASRYKDQPASAAKHVGFRSAADAGP
jgi:formylglycine-generating enzyme required for sulfatase activity